MGYRRIPILLFADLNIRIFVSKIYCFYVSFIFRNVICVLFIKNVEKVFQKYILRNTILL